MWQKRIKIGDKNSIADQFTLEQRDFLGYPREGCNINSRILERAEGEEALLFTVEDYTGHCRQRWWENMQKWQQLLKLETPKQCSPGGSIKQCNLAVTLILVHWDHLPFFWSTWHKLASSEKSIINWENAPIRLAYGNWHVRQFLGYWLMWVGPPTQRGSATPQQVVLSYIRKQAEQAMISSQ